MTTTGKKFTAILLMLVLTLNMMFAVSLSAGAATNYDLYNKTDIVDYDPFDNAANKLMLEIEAAENAIADGNNFVYETQLAVSTAILNARALLNDHNATDEQMLAAIEELKTAVANLRVPDIDTAYLWSVIERADYMYNREIRYTEDSYKVFSAAYSKARDNYHYGQSQENADDAAAELAAAVDALVPKYNDIITGDVDGDKSVTIFDATHIQRCLAMLETFCEKQEISADFNDDARVSILDATFIQRKLADL